jgi:hypothetical protein
VGDVADVKIWIINKAGNHLYKLFLYVLRNHIILHGNFTSIYLYHLSVSQNHYAGQFMPQLLGLPQPERTSDACFCAPKKGDGWYGLTRWPASPPVPENYEILCAKYITVRCILAKTPELSVTCKVGVQYSVDHVLISWLAGTHRYCIKRRCRFLQQMFNV